jgi:phospholipid/cholesterol/gamma-HCH transport system substrate-binding protein
MREGSVGLLILVGVGLFVGIALWIQGLQPGKRTFKIFIEFKNTVGLQTGAVVRFRGVNVGKITNIRPKPNLVEVEAELSPATLIIPKNVVAQVNQSGLISQTAIELVPTRPLTVPVNTSPLDKNCDGTLILCNNAQLPGESGVSFDELVQSTARFATIYSSPQFFNNVNSVVKNTSDAAAEIAILSREFTQLTKATRQELKSFSASARAVSATASKLGVTADQVNSLLVTNRTNLVTTLDNLSQTSTQLRSAVGSFSSVLGQTERGQLIQNLQTLTANAAKASANLRSASDALSSPTNLLVLQQTLDSARATFQNAQKITADLDELTGDPQFRNNLKNLVNGLSGLISSTQRLEQQTQTAQILAPIAASLKQRNANEPSSIPTPPTIGAVENRAEGNRE